MNDIKILHLMKTLSNSDGIPNFPTYVPYLLKNKNYNINDVLVTNQLIHPNIGNIDNPPAIKIVQNDLAVIRELVRMKPDILVIYAHFGSPLAFFLLSLSKIMGVVTIAETDYNEYGLPRIQRSFRKTIRDILRWLLIYVELLLVDTVVAATNYELNVISRVRKLPENKCAIIPWGTNFDIKSENKLNYILTASRWWRDRKNLHTALRVFSEVIKEKECNFIIVGKFLTGFDNEFESMYDKEMTGEEYEAKIMGLIEDLGIKDHVEFTGVVSSEELQSLYRHARVYYMPTKFETFGGVFVEAMASGTPIVAMKNSAVQYVVQDGVTGFLRDTEEGQKEALMKLFSDEALYREMQANCLKAAERYKWDNVIKLWEGLIDELTE
jgi:glycosyltransferase involved in cell wall biosynthesis